MYKINQISWASSQIESLLFVLWMNELLFEILVILGYFLGYNLYVLHVQYMKIIEHNITIFSNNAL